MPDGGRLTIETSNKMLDTTYAKTEQMLVPGEYIELAVSDSGHGISKDDLDHIFEPFYTTKPHEKGTGLGLSMVFGFTRRSKGYIRVYSEPGIGTTIRCYLPRSVEKTAGKEIPLTKNIQLPHGQETILVVDDEEDLIELAQQCLEDLGYTVVTAASGIQAMEVLAENPSIDLLFSDIVMPGGINGYELAEQAEASHPGIKVLLTSGYTGKAVAHNGQARFAANILSNPHTKTELAQGVRKMLDGVKGDKTA
ncbi:MAG: response regulator [Gammaproteobacteria bacterium]|nr:response regulator [Gammaproteobacteria bacterium]